MSTRAVAGDDPTSPSVIPPWHGDKNLRPRGKLAVFDPAYDVLMPTLEPLDQFLSSAREEAVAGNPVRLSIRELVRHAGAWRRGVRVLEQIQEALDRHQLVTEPSFATGWIDTVVELKPSRLSEPGAPAEPAEDVGGPPATPEASLTVGSLEAASAGVVAVQRNGDLTVARALMMRHNFSQLAVLSGKRDLVGAVSWESIAQTAMTRPDCGLLEATRKAQLVKMDDDLIALIPIIVEEGFVFVEALDRTVGGIITTADLSAQFQVVSEPFLLVGEIERRLRQLLSAHFSVLELAGVRDPTDAARTIHSAHDLTLGEVVRFIQHEENWSRFAWPIDRAEFVKALDQVREIRNDVMHFSPDPLSPDEQAALRNFAKWLRVMEAEG